MDGRESLRHRVINRLDLPSYSLTRGSAGEAKTNQNLFSLTLAKQPACFLHISIVTLAEERPNKQLEKKEVVECLSIM